MTDADNDIEMVPSDEEGAEGTLGDKLKDLRVKLKACEIEKNVNLIGWQRAKADFVNLTRRAEDDRIAMHSIATHSFIEELLPVIDSLEAALASVPENVPWAKGFENVDALIKKTLHGYGVTEISEVGVLEDPKIHESIQTTPATDTVLVHTVTSILQKGYKVGDRVIRAAKVVVAVD